MKRKRRRLAFERLEDRRLLTGDISQLGYFDTWDGGIIRSTDVAGSRLTSPSHGRAFFYARHSGGVEKLHIIAAALLLSWAIVFWIAALLSYLLGFTGVAATAFYIANMLGGITLLLAVLFFVFRRYNRVPVDAAEASG